MKLSLKRLPYKTVATVYLLAVGSITSAHRRVYESMSEEAAFTVRATLKPVPVSDYPPNKASNLASRAAKRFGVDWGHIIESGRIVAYGLVTEVTVLGVDEITRISIYRTGERSND